MIKRNSESRSAPPQGPSIISDYHLLPGVPDEMIAPDGTLRVGWDKLMSAFDALGSTELGVGGLSPPPDVLIPNPSTPLSTLGTPCPTAGLLSATGVSSGSC